jgi:hypothetical protein
MKTKNKIKKLPKGFTKNPELDKYANQELFKEKVEKAKQILNTVGVPKM